VKGRAYLGPCRCLRACVPVMSSLGHVALSSLHVAWSCRRFASASCCCWAMLPPRHCHMSSCVIVVAGPPRRRHCCIVVQCRHPVSE